jgi:di/tricarboxylate transporter
VTLDAWITIAVIGAMIVGLVQERLTPDVLVLGALALLLVLGVLDPDEALPGFASPTVITVAALFVLAAAMRKTGALEMLSARVFGDVRGLRAALLRLTAITSLASAFLNNTPIVAMLLPGVLSWARRMRLSPSKLLIPLSYAAIAGGVCTLIGTSTNLVVHGLLQERGLPGFGMFELTFVGLPCVIVVIAALTLFAPRLLPDRLGTHAMPGGPPREYLVEMDLRGPSPLIGASIEEAGLRHLPGLFLVRIERSTGVLSPVGPQERLYEGDRLTFAGAVETIVDLQRFRGLVPVATERPPEADDRWLLHEAVVSPGSPLVGENIRDANFRGRYNAAIVAVHRHGERVLSKIGDIVLRPGDTLLIEAAPGFARSFRDSSDFHLVSEVEESAPPRHHRSSVALLALCGVVGMAALGWAPVVTLALGGSLFVVAAGCLSPGDARRSIDASVLIVIGASFGLARALDKSGAAGAIATWVVAVSASLGPVGVLVAVYALTMVLTETISNNAAAALVFPVAMLAATEVGADPRPFAVAVAVAASLSLATPLGYQTNLMVYGPGGYRFTDFLRIGVPLQLLLAPISLALITFFWPLVS